MWEAKVDTAAVAHMVAAVDTCYGGGGTHGRGGRHGRRNELKT